MDSKPNKKSRENCVEHVRILYEEHEDMKWWTQFFSKNVFNQVTNSINEEPEFLLKKNSSRPFDRAVSRGVKNTKVSKRFEEQTENV